VSTSFPARTTMCNVVSPSLAHETMLLQHRSATQSSQICHTRNSQAIPVGKVGVGALVQQPAEQMLLLPRCSLMQRRVADDIAQVDIGSASDKLVENLLALLPTVVQRQARVQQQCRRAVFGLQIDLYQPTHYQCITTPQQMPRLSLSIATYLSGFGIK
jgi:hypothetical protein